MRQTWAIARKELRAYFGSPVAILFLLAFLVVSLFFFFWIGKFFVRGTATIRPLFEWLPLLLMFLVAALTMHVWSEEQRSGTVEILFTLPVPRHRLVLGKFLAGLVLLGIALLLTLGLPITVSMMGKLDWGPVFGGYLAVLLLGAAYLAIGLFVSSLTANAIASLILTVLLCAALYLPGAIADQFGMGVAGVLRAIGTGSRFESITRGVLDVRDLVYYASLIAGFLVLGVIVVSARGRSRGPRGRLARSRTELTAVLAMLNLVAVNALVSPLTGARMDLTRDDMYSLTAPTEKLLHSLDEPLVIRGFFSEKTHPLLAPLVPQLEDLLREYEAEDGDHVVLSFEDPSRDENLQKELLEQYDIQSVPFEFAQRNERAVVNAYFHILITYGDQRQVLSPEDLIDVDVLDVGDVKVHLKSPEYALTKAIRKVAFGFQSLDSLFASLGKKVVLTAYVTPETLPENWSKVPEELASVARKLSEKSHGAFTFEQVEPKTQEERQALFDEYGFKPYATSLLAQQTFYLHLLLKIGDKETRVALPDDVTESSLEKAITTSLKRVAPGFIKSVGLVVPPPKAMPHPSIPGQPPPRPQPPQTFRTLRQALSETYRVENVQPASRIPDDVDVLLLAGPENLTEGARKNIDQYLMRGGAVIALVGDYRLNLAGRGLSLEKVHSGLDELLSTYGVKVGDDLVLDEKNDALPVPVERDLGNGLVIRKVQRVPYPFFVRVRHEGMEQGGALVSGIGSVLVHWATPVHATLEAKGDGKKAKASAKVTTVLESSPDSWLSHDDNVMPDFVRYPDRGFGKPKDLADADRGSQVLAVAVRGTFDSAYAKDEKHDEADAKKSDEKNGDESAAEGRDESAAEGGDQGVADHLIERSPENTRLVVVGSSSFVSDQVLGLSQQAGSLDVSGNLQLVMNMVDWSAEDADLLQIRAHSGAVPTLDVDEDARTRWELINYGIAVVGLALLFLVARTRRRERILAESRRIRDAMGRGDDGRASREAE